MKTLKSESRILKPGSHSLAKSRVYHSVFTLFVKVQKLTLDNRPCNSRPTLLSQNFNSTEKRIPHKFEEKLTRWFRVFKYSERCQNGGTNIGSFAESRYWYKYYYWKTARHRTHIRAVIVYENKQFDKCRSRRGKNEACMLRLSSQDGSTALGIRFFEWCCEKKIDSKNLG